MPVQGSRLWLALSIRTRNTVARFGDDACVGQADGDGCGVRAGAARVGNGARDANKACDVDESTGPLRRTTSTPARKCGFHINHTCIGGKVVYFCYGSRHDVPGLRRKCRVAAPNILARERNEPQHPSQ
jgi:hypothetical protein